MVRYAHRDRRDLHSLADHLPLGKILANGARRGIVTIFTMAGFADITAASGVRTIAVGKAQDGIALGNNRPVMQSKKLVQALANERHPAHHDGEKPRQQRFSRPTHHYQALPRNSESASDQRLIC